MGPTVVEDHVGLKVKADRELLPTRGVQGQPYTDTLGTGMGLKSRCYKMQRNGQTAHLRIVLSRVLKGKLRLSKGLWQVQGP